MAFQKRLGWQQADLRTLGLFAAVSLAAVAVGAIGLALDGAPITTWVRNPVAWSLGMLLAPAVLAAGRSEEVSRVVIVLAIAGLVGTFLFPAQSGVHRWIDAGPLHVNMAALVLPATVVGLATLRVAALTLAAAIPIGLILVIQPDASQATAFLLSAGFVLLRSGAPKLTRIAGTVALIALVVAAWLRPDPLEPVPEVEGIFSLLAGTSPILTALAALALAASSITPLRHAQNGLGADIAAKALSIYLIVVAIAPAAGAFPVPLVGLGMSFPVGYWIGLALLCSRRRPASE